MQCFFDQLIGDMRPIEVAGVDVIDSEPHDLAQDCDRAVVIFRWPEYMWTSELHGAVAHARQDQITGELEYAARQGGGGHRFQIRNYELRIRKNENDCSVRCPQRRNSNSFHSALRQRTLQPAARTVAQAAVAVVGHCMSRPSSLCLDGSAAAPHASGHSSQRMARSWCTRASVIAFFSCCDFCCTQLASHAFCSSLIFAKRAGGTTKRTAAYVWFNSRSRILARSSSFLTTSPLKPAGHGAFRGITRTSSSSGHSNDAPMFTFGSRGRTLSLAHLLVATSYDPDKKDS